MSSFNRYLLNTSMCQGLFRASSGTWAKKYTKTPALMGLTGIQTMQIINYKHNQEVNALEKEIEQVVIEGLGTLQFCFFKLIFFSEFLPF